MSQIIPKSDPNEEEFISEIRQNKYIEKGESYYRINDEIEKRTNEIMEKIDKYWQKGTQVEKRIIGGGGGDFKCIDEEEEVNLQDCSFEDNSEDILALIFPPNGNGKGKGNSKALEKSGQLVPLNTNCKQITMKRATESVINCLQSKLANHETRLCDLHIQYREKISENTLLGTKVKSLEEDRERLLKTITLLQTSLDKSAKSHESTKNQIGLKIQLITTMKKEIEYLKRDAKQNKANIQSLQTRLNRTNDDNEKLKAQNKSFSQHLKEMQNENRTKEEKSQKISKIESSKSIQIALNKSSSHLIRDAKESKKSQSLEKSNWK